MGDTDRMKTPYELVVRELLPSSGLAKELVELVEKGFHDLAGKLIVHLAGYGSDVHEEVQRLTTDLENEFIDFTEPGILFAGISELISSLTDINELSDNWTRDITASSTELQI